jgi:Ca-activated chloride channel family protein
MIDVDRMMLRSHVVRLWVFVLSLLLLMGPTFRSAPGLASGQEESKAPGSKVVYHNVPPPSPQSQDLFLKLKSELVVLPISVTDSIGRFIPDLRREQFQVYEEDVPQSIRFFSTEDIPISIGIILDTSGSMKSKMARALEAVRRFIEWSNQQDEFFAITFNHRVTQLADFCDGEVLINYLPFLQAKGRTALYDAVYQGVAKLKGGRYGKRVLLVVSDGQDNSSRYGFRSLSRLMKESDVQIYTIGTPDPTRYDDYFERQGIAILQQISRQTGGRHFTVLGASALESVCIYIARELRQQYTIGYMSSNQAHDGEWRKIKVSARNKANFKLTKQTLENLKSEGVPVVLLNKLEMLKDRKIKAVGEEEYFSVLKAQLPEEEAAKFKVPILKHVKKEEGEKLRVYTKRGYYAPVGQP